MSEPVAAYSKRRTLSNARIFVAGKVVSAAVTLAWLAMLVRVLDVGAYAAYVSAIAILETGVVLATLGIDWLVLRAVPEYVVRGARRGLVRLLWTAALTRLGAAICVGLIGMGLIAWFKPSGSMNAISPLLLGMLMLSESCMRLLRDNTLESLGAQANTQLGIMLRTGLAILALSLAQMQSLPISPDLVLSIELMASAIVLLYSGLAIRRAIRAMPQAQCAEDENWQGEAFGIAFRKGWHNYVSTLASFPLSMQAMVLLVATFANAQVVASFGFVARLFDITRGYVPALMLMSVLRPRFIGLYAMTRDFSKLAGEAMMASRLSAMTVAPLVGMIALYGDMLIQVLSAGRVESGRWVLMMLVGTLLLRVHRQISVVLVNCVELSSSLSRVSLAGLLAWPFALVLSMFGQPFWGVVLAVLWDECVWVLYGAYVLRRANYPWTSGLLFNGGILAIALISAAAVALLPLPLSIIGAVLGCSLLLILFLVLAFAFGLLTRAQLLDLRRLVS